MDNETFEIYSVNYKDGKQLVYKMQVEIIYRSDHVLRFKVSAGQRSMIMEKLITKHSGQWKIKETSFQVTGDPKDISQKIMEMQDQIQYYLDGRPKPVNKYKNKP